MPNTRKDRPSRRSFCVATGAGLGAGLVLSVLPGCDPVVDARIGEGSLDNTGVGTGGNGGHGGGNGGTGGGGGAGGSGGDGGTSVGDMAMPPGDLASACAVSATSAGTASSYTVGGAPKLFTAGAREFFVVRDAGGLFAVNAACPHRGCPVQVAGSQFYCNCHGATFAFDGSMPTSPAHSPLALFALCVDASGNVTVDTTKTVPATTRA